MMSMDVSIGAAINAAPSPDPACAPAATSTGASDGFAALLDEAAGSTGDSFDASSVSEKDDADEEDLFDEMAALVTPSLLSLNTPLTPLPEDGNEEVASEGPLTDGGSIADVVAQSSLLDGGAQSQLISGGADEAGSIAEDTDGPLPAEWNANAQTMTGAETGPASDAAGDAVATAASEGTTTNTPRVETATSGKADGAAKSGPSAKSSRHAHAKQMPAQALQDSTAQQQTAAVAAGQADAETSATNRPQAGEKSGPTSPAARLARALERAAGLANGESSSAAAVAGSQGAGSGQQSGFGEELGERPRQSFSTGREAIGGLTFAVAGPNAIDMRSLSRAVDAATQAGEVTPGSIPERDVVAQLVHSMRMQFRDGIGEAVVKLRPEHLGSVQISIKVENGALSATVQAESPAVRQWLESQQDTLKGGLADHGLRLERFVVQPDGEQQQASDETQEREHRRRQQQRRMSSKDHPVFEVTV